MNGVISSKCSINETTLTRKQVAAAQGKKIQMEPFQVSTWTPKEQLDPVWKPG